MARSIASGSGAGGARPSGHRRLTPGSGAARAENADLSERSALGVRRLFCGYLFFGQLRVGCGRLWLLGCKLGHRLARGLARGRGPLLLGGELPPLGDDERLPLNAHLFEDVNRYCERADALERVGKFDLAPVDANLARAPDLVGDVAGSDRAEQRAGRTGLDLEPEHGLAQLFGDRLGLIGAARLLQRAAGSSPAG